MAIFNKLALLAIAAALVSAAPVDPSRTISAHPSVSASPSPSPSSDFEVSASPSPSPSLDFEGSASPSPSPSSDSEGSASPSPSPFSGFEGSVSPSPSPSSDSEVSASPSPSPSPSPSDSSSDVKTSGSYSGRGTWFTDSVGSCGTQFTTSDMIVAMNAPQQGGNNAQCGKSVRIQHNGKSVTAKVVDTCPECASGSLDLSQAAFSSLASLDQGVIDITWSFV
ncbi:hypothetical protein BGZ93_007009 [Podila epicladia]|nr:hypothetical protein BGZ92_011817 [Podila epicladia]KAG0094604.1 hypothetical protein BGZ93_007009 [Podila epicladia]